ncbi:hypothetical protein ST47_g3786 [Ascochyta rabiei]|uniref:Uncharacterized protein n=1 Tax=Didymella rabiei TaxID=5454 RepID=A0A163GY23_DIDRA|nr:hypothetical protein ST47_g3786 [Ascochyta rabiei]
MQDVPEIDAPRGRMTGFAPSTHEHVGARRALEYWKELNALLVVKRNKIFDPLESKFGTSVYHSGPDTL